MNHQTSDELHAALAAAESARARAEESEARFRLSEEREHFLAEASRVLSSSLDFPTTIQRVAELAVPSLADWCGVDIVEEGQIRQLAVAHADPRKVEFARELRRRYPAASLDAPTGVPKVIRTGISEFYPEVTDEMIAASARDAEHLKVLRELDIHGAIIAPLSAGGRTFGALLFVSGKQSRRYTQADVALAEELAHRAALAIGSARLYGAEQEARREAEAQAERTSRLQAVTAALSQAVTPAEVADAALDDSIAALGASHGALYLLNRTAGTLDLVKAVGLNEATQTQYASFSLAATLPLSDSVREMRPIFLESRAHVVEMYPALREANARATTSAWVMVPLAIGERALGGIAFGYVSDKTFDRPDRDFIDSLARQCALALERAQLYAAERAAREIAQGANRAKSDFLATMSHELRTPINAIQGYAQLLDLGIPGPVTSQQREYIHRVAASAQHLLGLVNEVLDLAKIESGTIRVEREAVVAGDTVDAALSMIRPQAAARQLTLSAKCEGESGASYVGDEHRVRQVLTNLLSNAVKFTAPGGSVRIGCAISRNAPAMLSTTGPFVVFSVSDTGSGIDPDQIERIFDPFTQAESGRHSAYTRGSGGTGLGLTISRRLARLMGGELTVESTPGKGSLFELWVPQAGPLAISRDQASETQGFGLEGVSQSSTVQDDDVREKDRDGDLTFIAERLQSETASILREFVENLRRHPQIPRSGNASVSQLEDHMATFLADVSVGLRLLEVASGEPSDLLRDSSAIMRTIMEQHGSQRFRLAWTEEAISAEMGVLREVTCEAIRRVAIGRAAARAEEACAVVARFVDQATRYTLASYRFSETTSRIGAADAEPQQAS